MEKQFINIYKIFPKSLIGAVTAVIGISLMGFITTYVQIDGEVNQIGVCIALFTCLVIAAISHYAKGICKILPFLLGILAGYSLSAILTVCGIADVIDISVFRNMELLTMPDFAFFHWTAVRLKDIIPVIVVYIAYTVSAMMECISDHGALSGIVGVDLYKTPGLGRIFVGEGIANVVGAAFGGLGICSYGEGVACVGFSKVASINVTIVSALMLMLLGYIGPVQVFIASIPSCVFAGAAIVLYGFIACSGIKMLQKVDLNEQKNLIIVSAVLSLGLSGLVLGGSVISFTSTALALIVGVVLNLILKEHKHD